MPAAAAAAASVDTADSDGLLRCIPPLYLPRKSIINGINVSPSAASDKPVVLAASNYVSTHRHLAIPTNALKSRHIARLSSFIAAR